MKLMLEIEVAEILRCSCSKVKRLRLAGKLAYVEGRPVLIRQDDLDAYLASVTRTVARSTVDATGSPKADLLERARQKSATDTKTMDARTWALTQLLLKPDKGPKQKAPSSKEQKFARRRPPKP